MMKSSSLLLSLILPLAGGCASYSVKTTSQQGAALGQSKRCIIRELGAPTSHYMNGFDLFEDGGNEVVQAHFRNGKADALFYYTFDKKISETWLSTILRQNSKGTPWLLEAKSPSGRAVYHSADGKYYAFLSKGNQLLVDTTDFFRKSLHQSGKSIAVDDLPECLFAPDHDLARIGSTEASVIRNYGQSIATAPDGAKEYFDGYQYIVVHYKNGRCDAVLYSADQYMRLNECWISCLQQLNSLNAWVVSASSNHNEIYSWTPKDDKVARLIKHRSITFYTRDYGKNRNSSSGTTDTQKSYFTATLTPCAGIWLGETEASMTKKLGSPTLDQKTRVYRDGDLIIRATFDHGVCNRIIYISKHRFTDHWISATLAVNSRGRAWFTFQSSTPKKSFYRTYDNKFYARLKDGTNLGIMTESVYREALKKVENRKKSHEH